MILPTIHINLGEVLNTFRPRLHLQTSLTTVGRFHHKYVSCNVTTSATDVFEANNLSNNIKTTKKQLLQLWLMHLAPEIHFFLFEVKSAVLLVWTGTLILTAKQNFEGAVILPLGRTNHIPMSLINMPSWLPIVPISGSKISLHFCSMPQYQMQSKLS